MILILLYHLLVLAVLWTVWHHAHWSVALAITVLFLLSEVHALAQRQANRRELARETSQT